MNQYQLYLRDKYLHSRLTQSIILGAIISATMFTIYNISKFIYHIIHHILLNMSFNHTTIFVFILLYICTVYAYQASLYTIIYNK